MAPNEGPWGADVFFLNFNDYVCTDVYTFNVVILSPCNDKPAPPLALRVAVLSR